MLYKITFKELCAPLILSNWVPIKSINLDYSMRILYLFFAKDIYCVSELNLFNH